MLHLHMIYRSTNLMGDFSSGCFFCFVGFPNIHVAIAAWHLYIRFRFRFHFHLSDFILGVLHDDGFCNLSFHDTRVLILGLRMHRPGNPMSLRYSVEEVTMTVLYDMVEFRGN